MQLTHLRTWTLHVNLNQPQPLQTANTAILTGDADLQTWKVATAVGLHLTRHVSEVSPIPLFNRYLLLRCISTITTPT